jgi:hypothetical protein
MAKSQGRLKWTSFLQVIIDGYVYVENKITNFKMIYGM